MEDILKETNIVTYNHIVVQDRISPFEHTWISKELPNWIHLEIETTGTGKKLFACSRIHVNKRVFIGPEYSTDFSDWDMLKDLSASVNHKFL